MADTLTFKLDGWTGRAGVSLIQGAHACGGFFYVRQADDVAGETEQDVVIHRHGADLLAVDSFTIAGAGHGSSLGMQETPDGPRVWIGHDVKGVGWYLYGSDAFHSVDGVPNGDVTVDADNDLLCVRVKNRYRGYTLSSVEAGKPKKLFDSQIPVWGKRFQGHTVTKLLDGSTVVLVHRDVESGGESRAHVFKLVDVDIRLVDERDTSALGDEAEGFMLFDDSAWIVKRVGGNNANRTVRCTRWLDVKKNDEVCDNETLGDDVMVWTRYAAPIHVAASLNELERQYSALFPNRPRGTDGALGNASHAARASDHNPAWSLSGSDEGVIRAVDLTTGLVTAADKAAGRKSLTDKEQRDVIAALVRREKGNKVDRINYVIHRFPGDAHTQIWSRSHGWKPYVYAQESSMPHDHHFHVSLMHSHAAYADMSDWFDFGVVTPPPVVDPPVVVKPPVVKPPVVKPPVVVAPSYKPDAGNVGTVYASKLNPGVKDSDSVYQVQQALAKLGFYKQKPTGEYGSKTIAAVKLFQKGDRVVDGDLGELGARNLFKQAGMKVTVKP